MITGVLTYTVYKIVGDVQEARGGNAGLAFCSCVESVIVSNK